MAHIRKHGTKWRVEVQRHGRRTSKVFDKKSEARDWGSSKELEFIDPIKFVAENKCVQDLLNRYSDEVAPLKKGKRWEIIRLKSFSKHSFSKVKIEALTSDDITNWKNQRLKQVSNSTVNREMNLLSAVFQTAVKDWKWITSNPVHGVSRPKEPKHRDRRISQTEVESIITTLGFVDKVETKQHEVAVMFLIALETAMRRGEIHGLSINDVNIDKRFVTLHDTKNGDKRHVPLSLEAVKLFKLVLPCMFTVTKGSSDTLFRKAVRKAGIENLRFHDSRHESITNLARKIDVLDLARMVGHNDPKSLMKYYNATATEIAGRLD